MTYFANRRTAGQALASELIKQYPDLVNQPDTLVLGLPRGGIPVAYEVARSIHAPLDAYIVRKLGVPGQEELAMGALAMDGTTYLDHSLIGWLHIRPEEVEERKAAEQKELARRALLYRDSAESPAVAGKKVILVDDGLATGATMRAALQALRPMKPALLVVAIPVAPPSTIKELMGELKGKADHILCLAEHDPFIGVGMWYRDFSQTTDEEVRELLALAGAKQVSPKMTRSAASVHA